MKKPRNFPAKELVFQEDDGSYYAVSLSFGLFAEGETAEEASTNLKHATVGYLIMCLKENETEEQIYRGAPKKYGELAEEFLASNIKPSEKIAKKKYLSRANTYVSEGDFVHS